MANIDEKGHWIDAAGDSVPPKHVRMIDKRRDRMVEKLIRNAKLTQERIRKLKIMAYKDIDTFLEYSFAQHGEAPNKGGNYIFTGFSGDKRVQIKIATHIAFDEGLRVAKQKIDACIERWSEGANDNLCVVIFAAFKVDKKGNLDTKRILGLRRLKITDADWSEAMDIISNALHITGTKSYLMFAERKGVEQAWETIRIDLAGV